MSKLVRFSEEMHSRLHKLAGRLQALTGKSTSVEAAVRYLFEVENEWKKSRKAVSRGKKTSGGKQRSAKATPRKTRDYPDPMRVFSFRHKKFV